jgi:hypothetical protein
MLVPAHHFGYLRASFCGYFDVICITEGFVEETAVRKQRDTHSRMGIIIGAICKS